ncbi:cytochrome c oxidase subunit II [Avrilella dinanensis]|uniref:Cytochrome c oxidase subunit 2 n=1 Tax=Avrilella dinanensis TaxID=2008672 RepID=A0A2M9R2X7_9FLAO|nr:cytochrome c oxidase subunit II [Avrilella dinanensis]PJR03208.1 cytochrome C oxidase subunit II [Avrilella dinanensis]
MTSLLIIGVVVLLGIAIWQLTKIFHLTQTIKQKPAHESESEIASERDNNVNGYLLFGFLGFIYALMIYSCAKWGYMPLMSDAASEHGKDVDNLMWISMILIFTVQIITQFLLHYFSFKARGIKGRKATFYADNDKLEMIWTIIPVIVLSGLILYGLFAWNNIMYYDQDEEVMYVEVYAKQFGWDVRYSGEDNTLGKANVRFIQGVNATGADMSDPNSHDDILASELHLPLGKKVVFKIRSQDVLHSAYFPHFRAQMNAVPGMVTQFAMVPSITTSEMRQLPETIKKVDKINKLRSQRSQELIAKGEEALTPYEFDYILLCNKICGRSHYNMQMKVIVESEQDFKKWLGEQKTLGQRIAEEQAGNEPQPAVEEEAVSQEEEAVSEDNTAESEEEAIEIENIRG